MAAPDPILTLAIETSNPSAIAGSASAASSARQHDAPSLGVALAHVHHSTSGTPFTLLSVEPLRQSTAQEDDLLPAIERLRDRCGIKPRDIQRLAVSIGPGGYTSLRIAIAAAKMIALATGAKVIAVPTANAIARRVHASLAPFAVLLASKGDFAFASCFDAAPSPPGAIPIARDPGRLIGPDDVASLRVRSIIADRFLPESIARRAADLGLAIAPPVFDPVACLEASLTLPEIPADELAPLYAREPEAVTLWRQRHGPKPRP